MQCSELVCEITLNEVNERPEQKKRDECQGADDFQSTRRPHHEMARDVPIGTGRRRRRYVTADSRAQKLSGTVGAVRSRWSGHDVVESCASSHAGDSPVSSNRPVTVQIGASLKLSSVLDP